MPQQRLSVAVYDRWNNASLNSSIASLYPAGKSPGRRNDTTGTPVKGTLPRAEYTIMVPQPARKTRGTRYYNGAIVTICVWGSLKETVDGYLTSIYNAYLNSEEAGTNPLTMTSGTIHEVDDGAAMVEKVDDEVFEGTQIIYVDFSVVQQVPA